MPVLERPALADSPLADLHAIAGELGIDGFRRLRKDDLIDAIVVRQGGDAAPADADAEAVAAPERDRDGESGAGERPKRRRGGRGRSRDRDRDERREERDEDEPVAAAATPARDGGRSSERSADRDRGDRDRGDRAKPKGELANDEDRIAAGVVEVLANGSGFVRLSPPEASDEDIYVSAAQVRRCELVTGDRVSGPVRPPRRSERYPSLVRVDTINGKPAEETSEGVRFDELPASWPDERIALAAEDPTAKAIEWLTPFGKGSRVVITGGSRSGKTEALRRLAETLVAVDGLEVSLVLAGVRPEEISDWSATTLSTSGALSFAASADAQAQAVERAVDNGKRVAARGGDAVVLIDTLDGLHPLSAHKALAAARNIVDGGSLTVIATASAPLGGETTVIKLDRTLALTGTFPALDAADSATLRPILLVGTRAANAIAKARLKVATKV